MSKELDIILQKLESFIKKYYTNQMIKGVLFVLLFFFSFFVIFTTVEYYGRFSELVRAFFYFTYLIGNLGLFTYYFIIPLLNFFKIGKHLSYVEASKIIAKHFTNVNDKVQNILELSQINELNGTSKELLLESIKQKSLELNPIPFNLAINFKDNFKFLKYLLLPTVVIVLITIINPSIISDGAERVINYNTFYKIPAPYTVEILNKSLKLEKGEDITVEVKLAGAEIPNTLFITFNSNKFLMKKVSNTEFLFELFNVNNNISFRVTDTEFDSDLYTIEVLPSPSIIDFNITVISPNYTNIPNFTVKDIGDISAAEGSTVKWKYNLRNTENISMIFNDSITINSENKDFSFEKIVKINENYSVNISNEYFTKNKLLNYSITVSKDIYPEIKLKVVEDSTHIGVFYFMGMISDDYGFKKLVFKYKQKDTDKVNSVPVNIDKNVLAQEYFFSFDFNSLKDKNDIEYYFEIYDNDAVNGSKSTKTSSFVFHKLTDDEISEQEADKSKSIGSKIEESKKLTEEIQKDVAELQKDLINNKNSEWENQKKLKNIVDKQKKLEKLINEVSKENKDKNKLSENQEKSKELIEKQKQIDELLKQVMDEDMKKLMEELKKLMEQFDEKKFNELSKDMEMSLEDMNKQLDKNLEQLKEFEVEKKLEKTINDLNKLAEKQDKLSEKTKDKTQDIKELDKEQKEQEDEFNKIQEELEELLKKNEALEKPKAIDDFDEERKDIEKQMNENSQSTENDKRKKASKGQKKSSQQMKDMAEKMSQMMKSGGAQQDQENMDDLRKIIDNLVLFSFNQEELLVQTKTLKRNSPKKIEITNKQKKINDDFSIIQDSLYALARRVPQLDSKINKEILAIKRQNEYLTTELEENNIRKASTRQQNIMTSANELALLLDEVMKQMKKQQKKQGDQQCQNPGNGKPSMSQMRKQQESLKKQLEGMIKDMKGKPNKPGQGQQMNKSLAKMLAQQEVFQQQLSELMQNSSLSPKDAKKLSEINGMVEQMKKDIANKNITPEMLKRQDLIITRMLEAEKSDYEREIDKKRKSEQGNNREKRNINDFNKYKESRESVDEIIIYKSLKLNKYYSKKYNEYLLNLKNKELE